MMIYNWINTVQVQIQLPEGEDFCTTYADCAARFPDAMSKWDAFYQVLLSPSIHRSDDTQLSRPRAYIKKYDHIFSLPLFLKGLKAVVDSPLTESEKKDSLLGLYWAAQMATSTASSACSTRSPVCLL